MSKKVTFPKHKVTRIKTKDKREQKEPTKASVQLGKILGTIFMVALTLGISSAIITVSIYLWKWALGL